MFDQCPLSDVPRNYAQATQSQFLTAYHTAILKLCKQEGRTCEIGFSSGYSAIWLSLRGIDAEGINASPIAVERARQVNNILDGQAVFRVADPAHFHAESEGEHYDVIHHQGIIGRLPVPKIRSILAQQIARAEFVVFSFPSVYYPFDINITDERLLPLEEWERILDPFNIVDIRYYGEPELGGQEHILCVLKGQVTDRSPLDLFPVKDDPYPNGISAIVHTRNESHHISECLKTLSGWTDEIIVCDMESTDGTTEIAREFTDQIVRHPLVSNFDRARNVSAMRARYRWVFYLDADERVPEQLGRVLRDLIEAEDNPFDALLIPFRHHFAGHWMKCLYPGYTMPRLFRNGQFFFNPRPHAGAQVIGRTVCFPAQDPNLALIHYSYNSLAHYLDKLNRYTDGEALNLHREGHQFHWKTAVGHFVEDFRAYYDFRDAKQDGVHGFIYSFLSAFYRFEQHAKLYEHRYRRDQLQAAEISVPSSVEEILEFALQVVRQQPLPPVQGIEVNDDAEASAEIVWSGPLLDPSGYGEESRQLLLSLHESDMPVAGQILPWSNDRVHLLPDDEHCLANLTKRAVQSNFIQIIQNLPPGFDPHPQATVHIGRTMFETDRLPVEWVRACNRMDYIWVPSEFNRDTFSRSGVDPKKIVVIPGCFDPEPYAKKSTFAYDTDLIKENRYTFLTVFDWTLHKGWDVLLHAFLEAFEGREDVQLVFKVWSTMGYDFQQIQHQAATYAKNELNHDLFCDDRVKFIYQRFDQESLIGLYRSADAFVLPSRGEGWGRPYMEAMACGKPTIGTRWSGNTAFMHEENSFLIDCDVQAVPEHGWHEIPTYRGHRWAEPHRRHLMQLMQFVEAERNVADKIGKVAQQEIAERFNRKTVGRLMANEIQRVRDELRSGSCGVVIESPRTLSQNSGEELDQPSKGPDDMDDSQAGSGPRAIDKEVREISSTDPAANCVTPVSLLNVRWEGALFEWHSLAHVNREFCLSLIDTDRCNLSLIPTAPSHFDPEGDPRFKDLAQYCFAPLPGPTDVHIRHYFPPRLNAPDEGHLILIQPWEYGYLPEQWIEPIRQTVSEVWCYSDYVRKVYIDSGIDENRLHIVPLGVDNTIFNPNALPYIFTNEPGATEFRKRHGEVDCDCFVFLFVGGTLHRKGIDILLDAYMKAFSAYDEVLLVIKDTGTETVYRGQNQRERIKSLTEDPTRPSIIYVEEDLAAWQMAGIYTAADCLIQPYRGEGFCLPALEAMACGIPVVVPDGGPTDDFVDDTVGWRIAAEKRPFSLQPGGRGRIGDWDCVGATWMFETASGDLSRLMRQIYQQRGEATRKGASAALRVKQGWTWRDATARALERIQAICDEPTLKRLGHTKSVPAARWNKKNISSAIEVRKHLKDDFNKPVLLLDGYDRPRISLCMIVRNEERVLGECLRSVEKWVDEIIVVDTGSTDRTIEIAQEYGAKLYHFSWCDDFSAARNISLSHATGDWIFWMDADDTLPEECGAKLHDLVLTAERRTTGYLMQVHIPPGPGEKGLTIVDHVKIFRNIPQLRFEGRIHEQILSSIYEIGGAVERSDLYVVHSGYDYSPEGQQRKRERDLLLLEKDLKERPDHPFVLFNIGMTAYHLKEYEKAIPPLERCLSLTKPRESIVRKVYAMLSGAWLEIGNIDQALIYIEHGLALFPNDPELLFRSGIVYREAGNLQAAEEGYLKLLTAREVGHIDSLDISMTGFKAHHNLGLIYWDMGHLSKAETHWQTVLSMEPDFIPSYTALGELYLRNRQFADVHAVVSKLQLIAPKQAEYLSQKLELAQTA